MDNTEPVRVRTPQGYTGVMLEDEVWTAASGLYCKVALDPEHAHITPSGTINCLVRTLEALR